MTEYICLICLDEISGTASGSSPAKKSKTDDGSASSSDACCSPCGHLFHKSCLLDWFQIENIGGNANNFVGTCPNCRTLVRQSQLYPVYFSENPARQSGSSPSSGLFSSTNKSSSSESNGSSQNQSNSDEGNDGDVSLQTRFNLLEKDFQEMTQKWRAEKEKVDCVRAVVSNLSLPDPNDDSTRSATSGNTGSSSSTSDEEPEEPERSN